jgi:hypothetical protein
MSAAIPIAAPSPTSGCVDIDDGHVRFRDKDYRADRQESEKTMTFGATECIRRFLLHVLPGRFHRIRHYRSGQGHPVNEIGSES